MVRMDPTEYIVEAEIRRLRKQVDNLRGKAEAIKAECAPYCDEEVTSAGRWHAANEILSALTEFQS